jgi:peptide/nickel transport system substrate-binding protein
VNPASAVLLLQTGEVDQIPVPLTDAASVEVMAGVTLLGIPRDAFSNIAWNLRKPWFEDRGVRQALTHALHREEMLAALLGGRGVVVHGPVSPAQASTYTDELPKFPYDPVRARALLAEAGWRPGPDGVQQKNGERFAFELLAQSESDVAGDVAVIVQQQLREIGVEARVTSLEMRAMLARLRPPRADFDAVVFANVSSAISIADAFHTRAITQGNNITGFSHAITDELIDRSLRTMDAGAHSAVMKELARVLAEEQPVTFLFAQEILVGIRSDIRGFKVHPLSMPYRTHEWWRDQPPR